MADDQVIFMFKSYKGIPECTEPGTLDLCQLRVKPNPADPKDIPMTCFQGVFGPHKEEWKGTFTPNLEKFSQAYPFLKDAGFKRFCRSKDEVEPGKYALFASKKDVSSPQPVMGANLPPVQAALNGDFPRCEQIIPQGKEDLQLEEPLSGEVVGYLRKKFKFSTDGCCSPVEGNSTKYNCKFTTAKGTIDPVIERLKKDRENTKLSSSIKNRLDTLIEAFVKTQKLDPLQRQIEQGDINIKKTIEAGNKNIDRQLFWQKLSIVMMALFTTIVGYPIVKEIIAKWKGRVKATDYGKYIKTKLDKIPGYDVLGRDVEARATWGMTDTPDYPSIILDAETGIGKDKMVEKMALLWAKGDESVPPRWRNAKWHKISPAEFQSNTSYRGNVADKVAEIANLARKGPTIIYITEIDLVFLSGGSTSGSSEVVGKLVLDILDEPLIKDRLLIIGTTSRGKQMLAMYPDLDRRANWPKLSNYKASDIVSIIDGSTKSEYSKYFKVAISRDMIAAAAKLTEAFYRPSLEFRTFDGGIITMPRFDAIKHVLQGAARNARDRQSDTITIDDVIKSAEQRCGRKLDHAAVQKALETPLDELEKRETRGTNHDDNNPPPAATGELNDFAVEQTPAEGDGSKRIAVAPLTNAPYVVSDGAKSALGSYIDKTIRAVSDLVNPKPAYAAVTADGRIFNIARSAVEIGVLPSLVSGTKKIAQGVRDAGAKAFGHGGYFSTVGTGLLTGAGILYTYDKIEAKGRKVPRWAEPLTFVGTGALQSIVMGGLKASSLVSFPAGIPAALTTGAGVHIGGKILGLDDKSSRWFSMIGASFLMPAAMTAEVGGVSAMGSIESALAAKSLLHAVPRILAGSARGGLHGLAVGGSFIAGVLIGHYIVDQVPNVVAKNVFKSKGDWTYSGMIAGGLYAVNKKIGDPTGKLFRWMGII